MSVYPRTIDNVFTSMRENGGKRPRMFDSAYLLTRYRSECGMVEIPQPVRRVAFPVVVFVGRLLGRHRRFDGAPEPVSRP